MRRWILVATGLLLILSGATGYHILTHYAPPPTLQGAYLQPARKLDAFTLLDHHGSPFDRSDLKGQWHLISYGYTHCPDICPTTLVQVADMMALLEQTEDYQDLRVLFYSVDGDRDRPEVLAQYVPYFHPQFIGLTRAEQSRRQHKNFEQGLGIMARVGPEGVEHGLMLFLLNPRAQLQAVFKPQRNERGNYQFSVSQLLKDYRAVRDYYATQADAIRSWAE
ncbi:MULTISPECIES: SCO family protein [Marinimicrobium]|jgi:protein SCO1/2|uniref:Protein SCO1/2 n=1 Tax=Marinimicrobium koreense TaxID=306545 RepID=A0A3N1NUB6_9GAMM|nr:MULTISPECIES: SCO family protein [Marinimicrobium]ROQ19459.1 protein SCO1/2 [Marinimicrobium koreense]|tara:strand:+ start:455 stop:1120 length:666 start_codon:yes stop_codon:yes gene_type:complete